MIELVEYRPSEVPLSGDDLNYLLDLVKGAPGAADEARVIEAITPTRRPGSYLIRPGPYVGRLGLPSGQSMDIASRFPFDDLVELIRLSGRLPIRVDRLRAAVSTEAFLVDVIAAAFTREVDRLIAFGLAKGYRRQRFIRPPYPGRPDVTAHLGRYAARPDRLVTNARRITIDTDHNRALAVALDSISRVPLIAHVGRSVAAVGPSFGRVTRFPTSADAVARIPLDRLTGRYRDALALAEIILRSQSLAPRDDKVAGASVLFNMPKVWESFVARWVTEQWGPGYRVEAPFAFDLTRTGSLRSEADVTVWDGDELVALYDAKYKRPGEKPSMGDVYQMVTYCTRLGVPEATLVYPAPVNKAEFTIQDVKVRMVGLSVGQIAGARAVSMTVPGP